MRDLSELEAEILELRRQVNWLLSGAMLENSSVDRGALQVRSEEGFIIGEEGSATGSGRVYGTLYIDGRLVVDGETVFNGPMQVDGTWTMNGDGEITGNVNITGILAVDGSWSLNGDGDIAGNVELTGNLSVLGAGRLAVGTNMVITPATDGGAITFTNGSHLSANASSIGLTMGTSSVRVGNDFAGLLAGGVGINVSSAGLQMTGIPEATSLTGLSWLAVTSSGLVRRVPQSLHPG